MKMKWLLCRTLVGCAAALLVVVNPRQVAAIQAHIPEDLAGDSASDPAYDSGWTTGTNGGYGWNGWQLSASTSGNYWFIASSTLNGDDGSVNSPPGDGGVAWDITSPSGDGQYATATRPLPFALTGDDNISCYFDSSTTINPSGEQVFQIENVSKTGTEPIFSFGAVAGYSDYVYADVAGASVFHDTGILLADAGFHLNFFVTGSGTYDFYVSSVDDDSIRDEFIGNMAALPINQISFSDVSNGSSQSTSLFFNYIAATIPEPGPALPLSVFAALLLVRRRDRQLTRSQINQPQDCEAATD